MSAKSWILHGPQGTGKTLHARTIADLIGLQRIDDEWDGRRKTFRQSDTLHITDDLPRWAAGGRRVISIDEALQRLRAT